MKKTLIFLVLLFSLVFVQAAFEVNSTSINQKYATGSSIKGSIEISFEDHPLDSYFTDSLENRVSLQKILEANTQYQYNCSSEGCESVYGANSPAEEKTFSLEQDEDEIIGFQFTGPVEQINDVKFSLSSDAGQANKSQLKIDILDDGTYETGNTKVGTEISSTDYDGCFDDSKTITQRATFEENSPYCQRIEMPEAPAYMLGAWIEEVEQGTQEITMTLYSDTGTYINECQLAKEDIKQIGSIAYCQVEYLVSESKDYYVCAMADGGTGRYRTKAYYDNENGCGFEGVPKQAETNAYKIAIRPVSFGPVGQIEINNTLPEQDFSFLIEEYIEQEYGKTEDNAFDCTNTCVIPMKISSYTQQEVTLSNLEISYDIVGISSPDYNSFYDIDEVGADITSDKQTLRLNNFFQLPSEEGEIDYSLELSGEEIFSSEVEITDLEISLSTQKTASGFPTTFNLTGVSDIMQFEWSFGDNLTDTTTSSSVLHTYTQQGNYTMTITMTDYNDTEFQETFQITVSNPRDLIQEKLSESKTNLGLFKSQLSNLDPIAQKSVEEIVNITNLETSINTVEALLEVAETQEDYDELIAIVLNLNIPSGVFQTSSAKAPFFVDPNRVDLDVIAENTAGYVEAGDEEKYENAVAFWAQENLHVRMSSKKIMLRDGEETYPIDTVFDITITPKEYITEDYYLYIADSEQIELSVDNFTELEGYNAIRLSGDEENIKVSGRDLEVNNLPIFISPALSSLNVTRAEIEPAPEPTNKMMIFLLALVALIFIGILVYMILQRWYKVKYEKYLFKDRTNLYNVMVYVNNAKKNGMSNDEIKSNLRKSGWSSEQIRYIMRKYEGKNTGMYELISKSKESKKAPQKSEKNPIKMSANLTRTQDLNRFNPRHKL